MWSLKRLDLLSLLDYLRRRVTFSKKCLLTISIDNRKITEISDPYYNSQLSVKCYLKRNHKLKYNLSNIELPESQKTQ